MLRLAFFTTAAVTMPLGQTNIHHGVAPLNVCPGTGAAGPANDATGLSAIAIANATAANLDLFIIPPWIRPSPFEGKLQPPAAK